MVLIRHEESNRQAYIIATRIGLIGALVCLAIPTSLAAPSGNPTKPGAKNDESSQTGIQNNPQQSHCPPGLLQIQATPTRQAITTTNHHGNEGGPKWTDVVIAIAAAGSFVFSAALWRSTHLLWKETKRLALGSETQSKDMKDSIAEAARAAKAMERLADASIAQAEAIKLQARAAVAADLSEFVVGLIDLVPFPDAMPGHADERVRPGPIQNNNMRVVVTIKNIGRTRSKMKEFCLEWLLVERASENTNPDPPAQPVYTNKISTSHIFDRDEVLPFKWSGEVNSVIQLNDSQIKAINTNNAWLWVYGRIRYSDFLGDEYDLGFVGHWEATAGATIGTTVIPTARGFVLEGPPPYVFRRKHDIQTSLSISDAEAPSR